MGGKPSKGTRKDKRLKDNKPQAQRHKASGRRKHSRSRPSGPLRAWADDEGPFPG